MVASVVNSTTSPELWTMLGEQADALKQAYDIIP